MTEENHTYAKEQLSIIIMGIMTIMVTVKTRHAIIVRAYRCTTKDILT